MNDENKVNVPLLRKAVEWAEAEAAKPEELCEWRQDEWVTFHPDDPRRRYSWDATTDEFGLAPECGTCYCIAGYVANAIGELQPLSKVPEVAAAALGINPPERDLVEPGHLFAANNTIQDVRRIAEDLAGERL